MNTSCKILVAGSTGYLGRHIVSELISCKADFTALARSPEKLRSMGVQEQQVTLAQVTDPDSLSGCCDGVDIVISVLGITRQQDGMAYMDVDYQANLNLLREAERAGVKKFIYISAFKANEYKQARLLAAKEKFAEQLLRSDKLMPCVIRPNGFYSDLEEVYRMASSGRAYLFDHGRVKLNPIHGQDLARFCIGSIDSNETQLDIGGPDILSCKEIAELAFHTQNKPVSILSLPDWVRKLSLAVMKKLPEKWGGPAEFFLTVMSGDMIAPRYGEISLKQHFESLAGKQ